MPAEALFEKLSQNAKVPTKGSELAAGYDLYSAYDYTVPSNDRIVVMTDIQVQIPHGYCGRIVPRSELAVKNFIGVVAGGVGDDYTENLGVVLFNYGSDAFKVKQGDRIAQFICEKMCYPEPEA